MGDWLDGFIKAAKLTKEQERHLRHLSELESAKLSQSQFAQLLNYFSSAKIKSLAAEQLKVLTEPIAWTLYHMLDLEDQNSLPIWFKKRLRFGNVSAPEISEALMLLKKLELIQLKDGIFSSTQKHVQSLDSIRGQVHVVYHQNVLKEASAALEYLNPAERSFGSLTATVQREKIESLKAEINKFGQYLMEKYASTSSVDGEVIRVNIQLYPLTLKENSNE